MIEDNTMENNIAADNIITAENKKIISINSVLITTNSDIMGDIVLS